MMIKLSMKKKRKINYWKKYGITDNEMIND